ncbi:hypothetical protein LINGRAHAP2_LOCUS16962 [Linum grandiflorum]
MKTPVPPQLPPLFIIHTAGQVPTAAGSLDDTESPSSSSSASLKITPWPGPPTAAATTERIPTPATIISSDGSASKSSPSHSLSLEDSASSPFRTMVPSPILFSAVTSLPRRKFQ